MKIIFKILTGLLLVALMFSTSNCTYKNAKEVYPVDTSNCNTTNMSYSNNIVPIFTANHCYDCHGATTNALGDNYRLDTYAYVAAQIGPNPLYDDILLGNITAPDNTTSHMPQGGYPDLTPCDIGQIKAWINDGYKDN